MATQGVSVRNALESDMRYVTEAWCRSSYSHITAAQYLSKQGPPPHYQIYRALFEDIQQRIIDRSNVLIAFNEDDSDQILGFAVVDKLDSPVLHYIQVKKELWRNGVASTLLEHADISKKLPCTYTFTSPILSKWRAPGKWRYTPHWMIT